MDQIKEHFKYLFKEEFKVTGSTQLMVPVYEHDGYVK